MSLDDLIGARLTVGFSGTTATDALITHLREIHAQSLILFERNFTSPEQVARFLRRLEEALARRLLVMVDHEGGRVIRFRQGVTQFPDARHAEAGGPAAVEQQGAVEGQELKQLGVSVNLAPCVDVVVEGVDPIIGDRSYGSDPTRVGDLSVARIHGLQSRGVAACAKHFPGLGAVPRDPHKTLPTIPVDWPTMERVHLAPFRAAIGAEVALVMSSHVCYPLLGDPAGVPATFSSRLIHTLLRTRMEFTGVVITDDLLMGALRRFGTTGESAVKAAQAGHDLLLICDDLAAQKEAFSRLRQAYQDGLLKQAELETSVLRINRLRQKFLGSPP